MTQADPSGLQFLIAAKQCEMAELGDLTRTANLMRAVSDLVHELQRERGLSNLHLAALDADRGPDLAADRVPQRTATDAAWGEVEARLERMRPEAAVLRPGGQGARLYARVAQALQAQQAVPALRQAVDGRTLSVSQVMRCYGRIVSAWLAVVFEATDAATDAEVSRLLISLFNLMQARELTGQERAAGSALFAAGSLGADDALRVRDLAERQARCLQDFLHFAPAAIAAPWSASDDEASADAEERTSSPRLRLRRLLTEVTDHGALNPQWSRPWFEACTARLERLKSVENALLGALRARCLSRSAALEREVAELEALRAAPAATAEQAMAVLLSPHEVAESRPAGEGGAGDPPLGPQLARQVLGTVQAQAQRLQVLAAELDAARDSLRERKAIDRAKGLLMARDGLSEEEAYQALRQRAMAQGRRIGEVAEALLRRTN